MNFKVNFAGSGFSTIAEGMEAAKEVVARAARRAVVTANLISIVVVE